MRDNQTTRRMPMIVTAMACATASMLAGLALAPSAMAAGTTITLQGADGASLAGHTFDVYRIGTYTDQILNGTRISSLGVRGDTASNAWAADAIGIANAYDPSTAVRKPMPWMLKICSVIMAPPIRAPMSWPR